MEGERREERGEQVEEERGGGSGEEEGVERRRGKNRRERGKGNRERRGKGERMQYTLKQYMYVYQQLYPGNGPHLILQLTLMK